MSAPFIIRFTCTSQQKELYANVTLVRAYTWRTLAYTVYKIMHNCIHMYDIMYMYLV